MIEEDLLSGDNNEDGHSNLVRGYFGLTNCNIPYHVVRDSIQCFDQENFPGCGPGSFTSSVLLSVRPVRNLVGSLGRDYCSQRKKKLSRLEFAGKSANLFANTLDKNTWLVMACMGHYPIETRTSKI